MPWPVLLMAGGTTQKPRRGNPGSSGARLRLEEVEVVAVAEVGQQLARQAVQRRHHRQRQLPLAVAGAVDVRLVVLQRRVVVEPVGDLRGGAPQRCAVSNC